MDYSIIIGICIALGSIGIVFLVKYLKDRKYIDSESLLFATRCLGLTAAIIDELNLKNEKNLKTITNIVLESLNYAYKITTDETNVKQYAKDYALNLCKETGIELNENRIKIIDQFIELGMIRKNKQ